MKRILFIVVFIFCCIISDVYSRDNSIGDELNGYLTDGVVLPHSLLGGEVNQNEENYFSYVSSIESYMNYEIIDDNTVRITYTEKPFSFDSLVEGFPVIIIQDGRAYQEFLLSCGIVDTDSKLHIRYYGDLACKIHASCYGLGGVDIFYHGLGSPDPFDYMTLSGEIFIGEKELEDKYYQCGYVTANILDKDRNIVDILYFDEYGRNINDAAYSSDPVYEYISDLKGYVPDEKDWYKELGDGVYLNFIELGSDAFLIAYTSTPFDFYSLCEGYPLIDVYRSRYMQYYLLYVDYYMDSALIDEMNYKGFYGHKVESEKGYPVYFDFFDDYGCLKVDGNGNFPFKDYKIGYFNIASSDGENDFAEYRKYDGNGKFFDDLNSVTLIDADGSAVEYDIVSVDTLMLEYGCRHVLKKNDNSFLILYSDFSRIDSLLPGYPVIDVNYVENGDSFRLDVVYYKDLQKSGYFEYDGTSGYSVFAFGFYPSYSDLFDLYGHIRIDSDGDFIEPFSSPDIFSIGAFDMSDEILWSGVFDNHGKQMILGPYM